MLSAAILFGILAVFGLVVVTKALKIVGQAEVLSSNGWGTSIAWLAPASMSSSPLSSALGLSTFGTQNLTSEG